jgi:hypothetical protein
VGLRVAGHGYWQDEERIGLPQWDSYKKEKWLSVGIVRGEKKLSIDLRVCGFADLWT